MATFTIGEVITVVFRHSKIDLLENDKREGEELLTQGKLDELV